MDFLQKSRKILMAALTKAGNDPVLKTRILHELNNVDYTLLRQFKLQNMPSKEYQEKVAFSVHLGIMEYINTALASVQ